MTTNTAARILATDNLSFGFVDGTTVLVSAGQHDYDRDGRSVSVTVSEGEVSFRVSDTTDHAFFWMNTEEARAFAQHILDATA